MGVLDQIKNFFSRKKTKQLNAGQEDLTEHKQRVLREDFVVGKQGKNVRIEVIQPVSSVRHSDGHKCDLMLATVYCVNDDDAIQIGEEDYIAFEVQEGVPINEVLLQKVAEYYDSQKNVRTNQECVYIGEVNADARDYSLRKSEVIGQYVETKMVDRLAKHRKSLNEEINQQLRQAMQEREEYQTRNFEYYNAQTQKWREQSDRERAQRKQNPYFRQKEDYRYGEKWGEYFEGVNVETGNYLRMMQLKMVTQDREGRYLYTAYLDDTFQEDEMPRDDLLGIPICFATDKSIIDIVSHNNPVEVHGLLELLSQERIRREDNGYMNFIGTLDRNGKMINGVENSQAFNQEIMYLKQQAKMEMLGKQSQFGRSEN